MRPRQALLAVVPVVTQLPIGAQQPALGLVSHPARLPVTLDDDIANAGPPPVELEVLTDGARAQAPEGVADAGGDEHEEEEEGVEDGDRKHHRHPAAVELRKARVAAVLHAVLLAPAIVRLLPRLEDGAIVRPHLALLIVGGHGNLKMAAPTPHSSTMIKLMGQVMRDRSSAIGFNERQHAANDLPHPLAHSPMLLKMKRHIAARTAVCSAGKKVRGDN